MVVRVGDERCLMIMFKLLESQESFRLSKRWPATLLLMFFYASVSQVGIVIGWKLAAKKCKNDAKKSVEQIAH